MSDIELESESDEEKEIRDIQKLNAALNDDEPCASTSGSVTTFSTSNSTYEEYSKLETLLSLNKMYDNYLRLLEKSLYSRLFECRHKLNKINKNKSNNEEKEKVERFRYVICGKPYFKDKRNFPAPDNEDTLLMRKSGMYDFSNIAAVTGWTINDKTLFLNVILKMSQEKKKMEFTSKIAELRRESKGQSSTNKKEISTLKRKINMVEKMPLKDVALPIDEEYDWECVANKLTYRHKAVEYRALWKLILHPTINKTAWSKSEDTSLQKIASLENLQNWNKIASLLDTGRTGYQCFVYFRTNKSNIFTGKRWTEEEEEYLKRLIQYYKEDNYIPWGKVAAAMENRTRIQIYNKYWRLAEFRKGRFLKEEDAVILTCSDKFGADFKKMAKYLPGRSVTQCRVRFQILNKKSVSTVWSIDEDRKLVKLLRDQDLSVNFSSIAKHFPDKDRQHIRSRYMTLTKWMKLNPNVDIAKAPRRAARYLGHGRSSHDLNSAVKRLKTRIESEVNNKKIKKVDVNSPESDIEDAIDAIIAKQYPELEEAKCHAPISSDETDEVQDPLQFNNRDCNARNTKKFLALLRVNFDKKIFLESPLSKNYKGLLEPDKDIAPVIKVKSYSRRKSETNLKVDSVPDIWGTKCLPPPTYVFPPNYSTITGCRKIMSFTSTNSETKEESNNINAICRRNILFKDETNLLMERYKTSFLWPMVLENQPPQITEPHHDVEKNSPKKPSQFDKGAKDEVNCVIDLDESASSSNDIDVDLDTNF